MYDVYVHDNTATYAGAIYAVYAIVYLDNCILDSNDIVETTNKYSGGAAIFAINSTVSIKDSKITNNGNDEINRTDGDLCSGVVYVTNCETIIVDSLFENNTGIYGGAIYAGLDDDECTSSLTVTGTDFISNVAYTGGAIYVADTEVSISDSLFDGNIAVGTGSSGYSSGGGAIQVMYCDECEIDNVVIINSQAENGGAINIENSYVTITDSLFENNTAGTIGGAIITNTVGDLEISGTSFINNGAGTYTGGIAFYGDNLVIRDSVFENNTQAGYNGALFIYAADATIDNTVFRGNNGSYTGGIWNYGSDLTVTNSLFEDNSGRVNIYNIYNQRGTVELTGNTFKTISDVSIDMNDTYVYGQDVNVSGVFYWGVNVNTLMNFTVDGVEATANVKNTVYTADLGNAFAVGNHTIVISTFTDEDGNTYVVETAQKTFEVKKAAVSVEVENAEAEWGETATVQFNVTGANDAKLNGTAIVTVSWDVDGVSQVVTVSEGAGEASFNIADSVAPGTYDVRVDYIGDDSYENATGTATLTLTDPKDNTIEIEVEEDVYGETTFATVSLTDAAGSPIAAATVTYTVDDGEEKTAEQTDAEGQVIIPIDDLDAGDHNITVKFNDGVHTPTEETANFTVAPANAEIVLDIADVDYGEGIVINVIASSGDDPVSGDVIVAIDGVVVGTIPLGEDGLGNITVANTYPAGQLYANATLNNSNYIAATDDETFNVNKADASVSVSANPVEYGNDATVTLSLTDSEGNPIEGTVIVSVGDETKVIEASGDIVFATSELPSGAYEITARFVGNDNFNEAYGYGTLTVTGSTEAILTVSVSNVTYGDASEITVTLVDAEANGLSMDVIVKIGDLAVPVSVRDGTGSEFARLDAGDYTAIVSIDDEVYGEISAQTPFNVAKAESAIEYTYVANAFGQSSPITITLTSPVEGISGKVDIIVNGETVDSIDVDESGIASYDLTDLIIGVNLVKVVFNETTNYMASSYEGIIFVDKASAEIIAVGSSVEFGESSTVSVILTGVDGAGIEATVIVSVDLGDETVYAIVETNESGEAIAVFDIPAYGSFDVKAEFLGSDFYYGISDEDQIVIAKPTDAFFDLVVDDIGYGEDLNIIVNDLTDVEGKPLNGTVTVSIEGVDELITIDIIDGEGSSTVSDLAVGVYELSASFVSDDGYYSAEAEAEFEVTVGTGDMEFNVPEVIYRDDLVVYITNVTDVNGNPLSGIAIVTYNDGELRTAEGEIVDGVGEVKLTDMDAGVYQLAVSFANDDVEIEYLAIGVVIPNEPELSIEVDDVSLGKNATAVIRLAGYHGEYIDEDIVVSINGEEIGTYTTVKGKVIVEIPDLTVGNYTISAIFAGNNNYNDAVGIASFDVSKTLPSISVEDTEAEWGEPATIKFNVTGVDGAKLSGEALVTVSWDVDGVSQVVSVSEGAGEASFNIANSVAPGTYDVSVKFLGNDLYDANENTEAKLVLTDPKANDVEIAVEEGAYGETTNVTVSLTDAADSPIAAATLTYTVDDGEEKTAQTNAEGQVIIPIDDLEAGDHNITVKFDDGVHTPTGETVKFTVAPASTAVVSLSIDDVSYGEEILVKVSAEDESGVPIAGDVNVEFDGFGVGIITLDGNGEGTLSIPAYSFPAGTIYALASLDNSNYVTATDDLRFIVKKAAVTVVAEDAEAEWGEPATVLFNVTGADGAKLNGTAIVTVSWDVDGVSQVVSVSEGAGEASFNIADSVAPGSYDVSVYYIGDDNYENATGAAKLTLSAPKEAKVSISLSENPVYGEDANLTIDVQDASGAALANTPVTVLVDGKEYANATTDENGNIVLPLELDAGDHNITVKVDDGVHTPVEETVETTVAPASGVIVSPEANATEFGSPVELLITVEDAEGNALDGTATVSVNGDTYAADVPVVDGKAKLDLENLDAGVNLIEVSFENPNYAASTAQTPVEVLAQTGAVLTITPKDIKEGEEESIAVSLVSADGTAIDGIVIVTIDDVNYAATLVGGKASLVVKNLAANDYAVDAKFIGTEEFAPVTANATFTVAPYSDPVIDIEAGDEELVITLSDKDGNPLDGVVNVTVDGETKEVPVVNGTATIPVSEGDHNISVSYPGDDSHAPLEVSEEITVTKEYIDTVVTVAVDNITYGQTANVAFTLKDINGNDLSGLLNVTVDDVAYDVTITNGVGSLAIKNLIGGNYTVVADYIAAANYLPSSASAVFDVKKLGTRFIYENMTTTSFNPNIEGRIGEYFTATLVDENGNALANKNVSVGFNGHVYTYITNATGGFKTQVNLRHSTNYTFALYYSGDDNYEGSFGVARIEVLKQAVKFTVPAKTYKASAKSKTLTATVLSKYGTPIKGKVVSFIVNGKYYSAKTNAKGVATVKVSLTKKGTYSCVVKFEGDDGYAATSKKVKLTIK
ncbi:Ig-like domain repeat protein [uncultured Methanobrevibacter sp.]|uniref:Ig-like domain repeat protein n=1 Tax=uncultured Methanobrevibacter sp. TaxID=253161 RepID=UPI00261C82FB